MSVTLAVASLIYAIVSLSTDRADFELSFGHRIQIRGADDFLSRPVGLALVLIVWRPHFELRLHDR